MKKTEKKKAEPAKHTFTLSEGEMILVAAAARVLGRTPKEAFQEHLASLIECAADMEGGTLPLTNVEKYRLTQISMNNPYITLKGDGGFSLS